MLSSWRMYEMHLALFLKAGCDNICIAFGIILLLLFFIIIKVWYLLTLSNR
jgi:hypothetical protein